MRWAVPWVTDPRVRKYDAELTFVSFGDRIRDEVNLERPSEELVGLVHETMQPVHASLWLADFGRPA